MTGALASGVRAAEPRAVARALTVVENDPAAALALLASLSDVVGRAHRVGVTGPPGAGKSTLIAGLCVAWRKEGRRVGVVAVDPTSPFTSGALLGDRIRMTGLSGDPGVFIRSLATRGEPARLAAQDAADVLDGAGFDPVVLETVGVGQSEVAIAGAADTVVVVVAPGSGDAVQAMKGGLVEAADLLVVNQADREGAPALVADLEAAIELRQSGRRPRVLRTVARTGEGVDVLHAAIDEHRRTLAAGDGLGERRRARAALRVRAEVDRRRREAWWTAHGAHLERLASEVAAARMTVAEAAGRLLSEERPPGEPAA